LRVKARVDSQKLLTAEARRTQRKTKKEKDKEGRAEIIEGGMKEGDAAMMREALAEAHAAAERGEVPVGAIVVDGGRIIARAHNRTIADCDPTAHAEMVALREAARIVGNHRLTGATIYVTVEPCAMCAGAMIQARVARLVYGCAEPKGGAVRTSLGVLENPAANHQVEVVSGVLAEECAMELREFFEARR
jgi:tRNA(adenine34) deaminase